MAVNYPQEALCSSIHGRPSLVLPETWFSDFVSFWPRTGKKRAKSTWFWAHFLSRLSLLNTFHKDRKKKSIFPSFLWLLNPYENPIWFLLFCLTSTICTLYPLQVISDLWVPFSGRMITVFHGGGERSDGLMSLGEQAGRGGQTGRLLLLWRYSKRRRLTSHLPSFLFASFISLAKAQFFSLHFFHSAGRYMHPHMHAHTSAPSKKLIRALKAPQKNKKKLFTLS